MSEKVPYHSKHGFTAVPLQTDVLTAALERIRHIYSITDNVVVSFSGGKDSTVALFLTLTVAKELNRLPLMVFHFDEELIDPDTVAYTAALARRPEFDFHWLCVPIRHSLRSLTRSSWWPWDPDERDVWARQPPPGAVMHIDGFQKGEGAYRDACYAYINQHRSHWGRLGMIAGIRTEESFNRKRSIIGAGNWYHDRGNHLYAKPIFDWGWRDVWRAIGMFKWPFSDYYNKAMRAGIGVSQQRVAVWGNASSGKSAVFMQSFYPRFWDAAILRLPEIASMGKYGNTKLYSGLAGKPDGLTWQEYAFDRLAALEKPEDREYWMDYIERTLHRWRKEYGVPFPDTGIVIEYESGVRQEGKMRSWKQIAFAIAKNDPTGRDRV